MANMYYEDDFSSYDDSAALQMATVANWAGALISLALIVGLAVWGYQLLVRDVTGVPVVRALEGPMRITPTDPGGQQAEYQGLSVTRVGVEGAAERETERVVLAPAPLELAEEDLPVAALLPDEPSVAALPTVSRPAVEEPRSAIELAIAEALAETADPAATATAPVAAEPTVATANIIPASVGGVAQSPRPVLRPRTAAATVQNAVAVTSTAVGIDVDPSTIPAGTRLVQLGAFPSLEEAREAWSVLDNRFGPYLEGKGRVLQEASAGGATFYRLRATGFEDLSDARRFCAVLVAENANCIPVIRR
ncbi:MAG: SPOR domain-containing protein [Rhodobacteraceae bacterium]|nr:SPOR domain-containing protein [Alphaproteobacteria bacterium]NNF71996.1 SPOR domain-containing protein [Paracoccaceae bacterium]NNK65747.1 SPOR domain-containing protein [Paracoccaceae bacterium]